MKHTWKKTAAFIMALMLVAAPLTQTGGKSGLFSKTSITAYAADPTTLAADTTTWENGDYVVPEGGVTISGHITVNGTVNLTLPAGTTLTANTGITLSDDATLNVTGEGAMIVNGTNNSIASTVAGTGTLVLTSGTLTAKGGNGGNSNWGSKNTTTNAGGVAINGSVTLTGGTLTVTGGNGGSGGAYGNNNTLGDGGAAISGDVTISGGTLVATGGSGGNVGDGLGRGDGYGRNNKGGAGGAAINGALSIDGGEMTATIGTSGTVKGDYNSNSSAGAAGAGIGGTLTLGKDVTLYDGLGAVLDDNNSSSREYTDDRNQIMHAVYEVTYAVTEITHTPAEAEGTVSMTYGDSSSPLQPGETSLGDVKGKTVTLNITPKAGYRVKGVTVEKPAATTTTLDNTITAWRDGTYAVPAGGLTYSDAITVAGDVTLVLTDGETLTLNKGIGLAEGATLTVQGGGTMNVCGTNYSTASTVAGTGTLVLTSGTLTAKGGNGQSLSNPDPETKGNAGGVAINGAVIVNGGILTATGGDGGSINASTLPSCNGGAGGAAISGAVTINSGTLAATGGNGGSITITNYGDDNRGGAGGAAIGGAVTINGGTLTATKGDNGTLNIKNGSPNYAGTGSAGYDGTLTLGANVKLYEGTDDTGTVLDDNDSDSRAYSGEKKANMYAYGSDVVAGHDEESNPEAATIIEAEKQTDGSWQFTMPDYSVKINIEYEEGADKTALNDVTIADFTYDGTEKTPVLKYGETTLVKDTDYELVTSEGDTASATNAGTYTIHVSGKGNYTGENIALTWKINKADVNVTADAKSKKYGEDDPVLTYTAGALFGTDAFTGALARAEGEAVNTYAITQGTLSAGDNYNINFTGADFTIAKATPTPEAVTGLTAAYGKTLADVELPDGWAWDNPSTSVGNVGSKIFSATLTPTDTANYNPLTTDLTVNVTAIPAAPTAVGTLNATYGDTLADVDLPTADDGIWAWKDDTTSVGNAGEQTFKAVFTPSSPNYTAVEQDVTINVAKADPIPDAVTGLSTTYGKKLSDVTLPDGWAWVDDTLSVGNVGDNAFAATYTPTDTDNYNTLNQNLTVNVVAVDKTSLNEAIAAANTYRATIQKTVYADPALALISAITAANAVAENDNVTEAQVAQAITDVNNAVTTAKAAVKDIDDTKAAQAVTDKINALPAAENIKSTDKEAIEAARAAYANLTEAQSAKVTKAATDKLTAAEKAVADHIAADAVIEKINAISEVVLTNESKALIDAARTAYEALATDAQKALVSNYTTLTADEQKYSDLQVGDVKAKIDAIGDIELTDESKAAIDTARAAFKALNADQQALVANAKVLDYAEKLYEALDAKDKADKDKADAEKSAAEALDKATKAETDKAAAETEAAKALDNAAKAAEAQAKAEAEAAAAKTAQATAEKAAADAKTAQTKAEEDAATAKTAQATAEKAAADAKTAQTKAEEEAAAAKTAQANAEKAQATAEKAAADAKTAQTKAEEDAAAAKTAQATAEKNAEAAKAAQAKAEEDAATAKTAQATAEKNAEAANSKVSDLTEQLAAAVKQIEELESSGNVDEALKKQVAELKEQLDAAKTAQNEANEALAKAQDVAAAKIAAAEKAQATAEQTAKEATEKAAAAEKAQATAEQTAKEATEKAAAAEKAQATAEQNAKEATEKAAAAEKAQATAEQTAKEATEKAAAAEEAQKVAEAAQAEAEKKAAEDKAAADQAAADKVIKLIDAIGNVEKTNTSENKIVAARAAYDALTDEQKALVTNYTVLTKAESAYKTLPQTGMSGFHKVFAGLAALMGITGMGLIKKSRKEDEEE